LNVIIDRQLSACRALSRSPAAACSRCCSLAFVFMPMRAMSVHHAKILKSQ
jgi:hypothetical protein